MYLLLNLSFLFFCCLYTFATSLKLSSKYSSKHKIETILLTGFEPFQNQTANPSWQAVLKVPPYINGVKVVKLQLPVSQHQSMAKLVDAITSVSPDIVLSVGEFDGRVGMSVERIGINIDDFRIPDNRGKQPIDEIIKQDGESAYFSNLPIKKMVKNMVSNGIPTEVSDSAGTFVCNHVLYSTLYYARKANLSYISGFIHVPLSMKLAAETHISNTPFMSTEDMAKGLKLALEACLH